MSNIKVFEDKKIRTQWNETEEDWYFSVVDVIEALTNSVDPTAYWRKLKQRLKEEGNETVTNCHALKMIAKDGKLRLTDVVNTKDLLRLIQSIPSKKAEPFKMWLAQVGSERLDEIADPEKAMQRGVDFYRQKGYPAEWITQMMLSINSENAYQIAKDAGNGQTPNLDEAHIEKDGVLKKGIFFNHWHTYNHQGHCLFGVPYIQL